MLFNRKQNTRSTSAFKTGREGFTLLELLVVVVVIGILAALAIPSFSAHRQRANNAAALLDLNQVKNQLGLYYLEKQCYP